MVGQVQVIGKGSIKAYRTKYETRSIHAPDIVRHFLEQRKVDTPEQYVAQVCFENTHYLPVFYYVHQVGWSVKEAVEAVKKVECSAQGTKRKLIERLTKPERIQKQGTLAASTPQSQKRSEWVERLRAGKSNADIPADEHKYVFEAVTHLEREEFDPQYVLAVLRDIIASDFSQFSGLGGSRMRQAVAHLDMLLSPLISG
jgi:hypothetical protein